MTHSGRFEEVLEALTNWAHRDDSLLHSVIKLMGQRVGEEAFLKQLDTLRSREDCRGMLSGHYLSNTYSLLGVTTP